jgi:Kef-type K+ transport system membrane component KefB
MGLIDGFSVFSNDIISKIPVSEFLLIEIGIIIIFCAVFAAIARLFRQPPFFAYVFAGFIIGPAVLGLVKDISIINSLSEIGIAFLVFLAGLEISLKKLKQVNMKKIVLVGIIQTLAVFGLTLLAKNLIGLDFIQGIYAGIIVAFSSTIIVLKILSDKGEMVTLHGRILIAILLLQDLIAIVAIAILTSNKVSIASVLPSIVNLIILTLIAVILQRLSFEYIFKRAASSKHAKELLILYALAVLFLFVIMSLVFGLSIIIGAFIAGVSLANLTFKTELESRMGPLRDFFSILFFVALGMQVVIGGLEEEFGLFLFLIIGALIIKPIITFILLRVSGYTDRTCFYSSLGLGQLSEFSIILGIMGFGLGILNQAMLSTIIIATIVTMSLTVFFLDYESKLYTLFRRPLSIFNFISVRENTGFVDKSKKTILLVGCDRMGKIILRELVRENREKILVVDFNPEIVAQLKNKKISCVYGDVRGIDVLKSVNIEHLEEVISTVPDLDDGLLLLKKVKGVNGDVRVILTAQDNEDAIELYENGADYVMLPRFSAGEIVSNIIKKDNGSLANIKKNQINRIKESKEFFGKL